MPLPIIFPTTFNVLFIVDAQFNVVNPDTFNDDNNVDWLDTIKFVKFVLLNIVVDVLFKLLIDNIEFVDKLFKLLKVVVHVASKLLINNLELVEKLFKILNSCWCNL